MQNTKFKSQLKNELLAQLDLRNGLLDVRCLQLKNFANVEVVVSGAGAPLLFLHDVGVTPEIYEKLIKHFAKKYLVIAPALPGHGSTKLPDWFAQGSAAQIMQNYLQFLTELLEKLDLKNEQINIAGHSFGGAIALKFAHEFDTSIAQLILIDSAGIPGSAKLAGNILANIRGYFDFIWHNSHIPLRVLTNAVQNLWALLFTYRFILNLDLTASAHNLPVRTAIYWGEKDNLTPMDSARKLQTLIKSKLHIIENRHHNWLFDSPERIIL